MTEIKINIDKNIERGIGRSRDRTIDRLLLPYWVFIASRRFLLGLPCLFILLSARGIQDVEIGIGLVALAITQLGFEMPSGVLSDRVGRKVTLLLAALFRVAGWVLFAFAYSPALMIIGFACIGASFAFDSGTDSAWLFDTLKDREETDSYALFEAKSHRVGLYSLGLATVVGGWLMIISPYLAVVCTVVPLLVSLVCATFLWEPKSAAPCADSRFWGDVIQGLGIVWREKFLFQVVVLCAFAIGALEVYFRFIQQFMQGQLGIDVTAFGYIYALWLCLAALSTQLVPTLVSCTRVVVVARWAVVTLGLGLLTLGGAQSLTALVLTAIPQLCFGILPVLVRLEVNNSIESSARATIVSAVGFLTSVAIFILAPAIGYLSDTVGRGSALVCLGFGVLGFAVLAHVLFEARRWNRERTSWMASLWG